MTAPDRAPAEGQKTEALYALHAGWEWDADVMRCRECNRPIHISRSGEVVKHAAECSVAGGTENPWATLRSILDSLTTEVPAPERADTAAVLRELIAKEILWASLESGVGYVDPWKTADRILALLAAPPEVPVPDGGEP